MEVQQQKKKKAFFTFLKGKTQGSSIILMGNVTVSGLSLALKFFHLGIRQESFILPL